MERVSTLLAKAGSEKQILAALDEFFSFIFAEKGSSEEALKPLLVSIRICCTDLVG